MDECVDGKRLEHNRPHGDIGPAHQTIPVVRHRNAYGQYDTSKAIKLSVTSY